MSLITRVRDWVHDLVHTDCDEDFLRLDQMYEGLEIAYERLEADHNRLDADHNSLATSAYRTDEALSESAEAHDAAETALAEAREHIADQDQELARMRGLIQAVRAALSVPADAAYQIEAVRGDDVDLDQLMDRMFEVMAIRQGLEQLVTGPPLEMDARTIGAAQRLIARSQERADLLGRAVT